jgi:tetratricopeptide (TPR) repeat protein
VCRYCGLLQPALAAQNEARRLDPRTPISINHTYIMLGDYQRAFESSGRDFGYALGLALAMLGRTADAIDHLREKEKSNPPRFGKSFLVSLRALLEGKREESLAASDELRQATFRDPEGMYYQSLQYCVLGSNTHALEMLARAIDNGFFCYPAMVREPWLDSLRGLPEFTALLRKAHGLHLQAHGAFLAAGGDTLLGIRPDAY